MATLDFSLKVISPAFVAGSMEKLAQTSLKDSHGKTPKYRMIGVDGDGLRVPSLRGVLRFWYRAKEGSADIDLLAKKEADIFGSTDKGQGIRLIPVSFSSWKPMVIGGEKDLIKGGEARAYLGYGPLNYVSKEIGVTSHNKSTFRDAVPDGTIFSFRAIGSKDQLEELQKCLLLLHLFGGIGSRSRRAWGSLSVDGPFIPVMQPEESIVQWFQRTLEIVWANSTKPSGKIHQPQFSAFCRQTQVRISKTPRDNFQEVMREFHAQFKKVRLYDIHNPSHSPHIALDDHKWEESDATSGSDDINYVPRRIAYGMPYFPKSRTNNWQIEYKGYFSTTPGSAKVEEIDRRASPLFLKVFQEPDSQKLFAVSLFLKADFFGRSSVEIGKSANPKAKKLPFPGWKAVEEFMNNPNWNAISLP